jgi:hypothetical protein
MKKIILKEMRIRNFKGIRDFSLKLNNKNNKIYGKNGVGKTTLYDAFVWCLFGKDSTGRSQFGIKPVDEFNQVIDQLNNEVKMIIDIEGKEMSIMRTNLEKWVTRRGTGEKVFDGNETKYEFDQVPVTKKEFQKRIESEIINENSFKLLTNLKEFNNLGWKKRRDILFEIAGNLDDEIITQSNPKLEDFIDMLQGRSFDDFKAMTSLKISKIKKEKNGIPIRLDEHSRKLKEKPLVEKEAADIKIKEIKSSIAKIDKKINGVIEKNKSNNEIISKISELKFKLSDIEVSEKIKLNKNKNKLKNDLEVLIINMAAQNRKIDSIVKNNVENENSITKFKKINEEKRIEYAEIGKKTFEEPNREDFKCPCCKQSLPSDNIDEKINELKINFNKEIKSQKITINTIGKSNNLKIKNYTTEIKVSSEELEKINNSLLEMDERKKEIEEEIKLEVFDLQVEIHENEEYQNVLKEIEKLEKTIKENQDTKTLLDTRDELQEEIKEFKNILKVYLEIEENEIRRNEILTEEQKLIDELVELENEEFKCEEFIRTKVELTESKMNSLFSFVKFKMFEKQVNGAMAETCKAMVNTNGKSLVVFDDANTAGQINAGIDIVNTLSNFYEISAPIFIDHNESIIKTLKTDSQLIGLYVSDDHEGLHHEFDEKEQITEEVKEIKEIKEVKVKELFEENEDISEEVEDGIEF